MASKMYRRHKRRFIQEARLLLQPISNYVPKSPLRLLPNFYLLPSFPKSYKTEPQSESPDSGLLRLTPTRKQVSVRKQHKPQSQLFLKRHQLKSFKGRAERNATESVSDRLVSVYQLKKIQILQKRQSSAARVRVQQQRSPRKLLNELRLPIHRSSQFEDKAEVSHRETKSWEFAGW